LRNRRLKEKLLFGEAAACQPAAVSKAEKAALVTKPGGWQANRPLQHLSGWLQATAWRQRRFMAK